MINIPIRTIILSFSFLICIAFTGTKKDYPRDYFQSPVSHSISLAGNFGELRPGHFHSGIDIRAVDGKTGEPIYAAAEGYVTRIKIQAGGYGKALYIAHPNGYTTVYAHLGRYNLEIDNFVKQQQYAKESFEIDVNLKPGEIKILKGQEVGKLGMSGRSYGPHLHFEVRDTKSDYPINPLYFGFYVPDHVAPQMLTMQVYSLNDKRETQQTKLVYLQKKPWGYGVEGDTINIAAWRAGFGVKVFDKIDDMNANLGVHDLSLYLDDSLAYQFETETFDFDETRYINAHMDFAEQQANKSYFNRCYLLAGNKLNMYNNIVNGGMVSLYKDRPVKVTIIAKDINDNTSKLEFWVRRDENMPSPTANLYTHILNYKEENVIKTELLKVFIPMGTLYENLYLNYFYAEEQTYGYFSGVHHIHKFTTPANRYFDVAIKPIKSIPDSLTTKAFVAYCSHDNKIYSCGGAWNNDGFLAAKTDGFGNYCIMTDNESPTIKPIKFSENMQTYPKMSFKIFDNYPTKGRTPYLDYEATLDGKWILMEYDEKNDLLTHTFEDNLAKGTHQLKIIVTDNRGNNSILEKVFVR